MKKYRVVTGSGTAVVVDADDYEIDLDSRLLTFKDEDEDTTARFARWLWFTLEPS